MKSFVLFTVAALMSSFAPSAEARSIITMTTAEITHADMDPRLGWNVTGAGSVTVDFVRNTITLYLAQEFHCPSGRYCAQVMPAPVNIELPLVSRRKDRCGKIQYKALLDDTARDGLRETLVVTDHSRNTCPSPMNATHAPTEVIYKTFSPWTRQETHSRMFGNPLQPGR